MARITHFDVVANDVERATRFYEAAFDWKISKWEGPMEYWLIATGPASEGGIDGGLSQGEPNLTTGQLTIEAGSLDQTLGKVKAAGGSVTRERSAIPGVGWLAEVKDTEGNIFGVMEPDDGAK